MFKIFILAILACFFISCSSATQSIRYQNGTTVSYELPSGWQVKNVKPPSDHFNIIEPIESIDSHPGITIDYYDETNEKLPKTQDACAILYLHEIHSVKDEDVKMDILKTIHSPIYGNITIYSYYSAYYGDHLVAFIMNEDGYCVIELWRTIHDQKDMYKSEFESVVRSITLKN
jgi:hypothetical protein